MSQKCESCWAEFPKAIELFEHIQASCLAYYKKHPVSWTRILANLSPDEDGKGTSAAPQRTQKTSRAEDTPQAGTTVSQEPSTSTESATALVPHGAVNVEFKCKCGKVFYNVEEHTEHRKGCSMVPEKEPPFCIMFRAQEPEATKPVKNVHMTVSDYFYGTMPGRNVKEKKIVRRNNCYSCSKTLRNNIRFMSHLRHKVVNEWEKVKEGNDMNICKHCYRNYESPFHLQCHLETVHASEPAACTCRICELHFSSEKAFLFHMKDKHVHNELPYVCKVCSYRSSFYADVTKHFREVHVDTSALMCPFCLNMQLQSHTFLKHVIQHIKKGADCQRCRLQFVSVKERALHQNSDHNSNMIRSKKNKFKNLGQCQVFVRVSSLTIAPQKRKTTPPRPPQLALPQPDPAPVRRASKRNLVEETPQPTEAALAPKKAAKQPDVKLPEYLCPLKRSAKLRRVRIPRKVKGPTLMCWECKESMHVTSLGVKMHFENSFECRWCVYVTFCKKAAHNHVLQEHADAELRNELLAIAKGETSSQTFSTLADGASSSSSSPAIKPEPVIEFSPLMPKPAAASTESPRPRIKERTPLKDSAKKKGTGKPSWKTRRKQPNPMKIADEDEKGPSKPKRNRKQLRDGDDPDIEVLDSTEDKAGSHKEKVQPEKKTVDPKKRQHRKVLAPEGYFPDLDDDEGWAKYFGQCGAGSSLPLRGKKPTAPKYGILPTMVPKPAVTNPSLVYGGSHIPPLQPLKQKTATLPGQLDVVPTAGQHQSPSGPTDKAPIGNNETITANTNVVTGLLTPVTNVLASMRAVGPETPAAFLPISVTPIVTTMPSAAPATSNNAMGPVYQFQLLQKQGVAGTPLHAQQRPPLQHQTLPLPTPMMKKALATRPAHQLTTAGAVKSIVSQVPQTPVNLRCLEPTHSSLLVQWDPPRDCLVTHYKVIFQGTGAPTAQLLPPEQTLVRLVGLKSDTMYVVRVYSLCQKAVSQYAFLYQKTKKLRADPPKPLKNDVVLVIDDNEVSDATNSDKMVPQQQGAATTGASVPQPGATQPPDATPQPDVTPQPGAMSRTDAIPQTDAMPRTDATSRPKSAPLPDTSLTGELGDKAAKLFKGMMQRTKELADAEEVKQVMDLLLFHVEKLLLNTPPTAEFTSADFKEMIWNTVASGFADHTKNATTGKAGATTPEKKTVSVKKVENSEPVTNAVLTTNVKSYLELEKKEKLIIINELLEGLKKNKKKMANQKAKALVEVTLDDEKEMPQPSGKGATLIEVTLDPGTKIMPGAQAEQPSSDKSESEGSSSLLAGEVVAGESKPGAIEKRGDVAVPQQVTAAVAPQLLASSPFVPQSSMTDEATTEIDKKNPANITSTDSAGPSIADPTTNRDDAADTGAISATNTESELMETSETVSKAVASVAVSMPTGETVSKAVASVAVSMPTGETVSKAVASVAVSMPTGSDAVPEDATESPANKPSESTSAQKKNEPFVLLPRIEAVSAAPSLSSATGAKNVENVPSAQNVPTTKYLQPFVPLNATAAAPKPAIVVAPPSSPRNTVAPKPVPTSSPQMVTVKINSAKSHSSVMKLQSLVAVPAFQVVRRQILPKLSADAATATGKPVPSSSVMMPPSPVRMPLIPVTRPQSSATMPSSSVMMPQSVMSVPVSHVMPRQILPKLKPTVTAPGTGKMVMTDTVAVPVTLLLTKSTPNVLDGQAYVVSDITPHMTTLTVTHGGTKVQPNVTTNAVQSPQSATATTSMREVLKNTELAVSPVTITKTAGGSLVTESGKAIPEDPSPGQEMFPEPQVESESEECDTEFNIVNVVSLCDAGAAPEDVQMPEENTSPSVVEIPQHAIDMLLEDKPKDRLAPLGGITVTLPPTTESVSQKHVPQNDTIMPLEDLPQNDTIMPLEDVSVPQSGIQSVTNSESASQKYVPVPQEDMMMPPKDVTVPQQTGVESVTETEDKDVVEKPTPDVIVIDDGPMLKDGKFSQNMEDDEDCILIKDSTNTITPSKSSATIDVDAAINKELEILGGSPLPASDPGCGNVPTLDDIKDIMDEDMAWLHN